MKRDSVKYLAVQFCNFGPYAHSAGCSECARIGNAIRNERRRAVEIARREFTALSRALLGRAPKGGKGR